MTVRRVKVSPKTKRRARKAPKGGANPRETGFSNGETTIPIRKDAGGYIGVRSRDGTWFCVVLWLRNGVPYPSLGEVLSSLEGEVRRNAKEGLSGGEDNEYHG